MGSDDRRPGMAHAILYSSSSSLIVPVVGLVTAPILTHSLGVVGRGDLAAAVAPAILIISVATLGLPQAVTYRLAQHPEDQRQTTRIAFRLTAVFGLFFTLAIAALTPVLVGGRTELIAPMLIADALALPALFINVLRAAGAGLQEWRLIALEKLINGGVRLGATIVFFTLGSLSVPIALVIWAGSPLLGGFAFVSMARRRWPADRTRSVESRKLGGELLSYGLRMWSGSIAGILIGRLDQALFASVSSTYELGIYTIAVTIADVAYLFSGAVADSVFGVTSRTGDLAAVFKATRYLIIATLLMVVGLGLTLPLWVGPVFGPGFEQAVPATWILLAASVVQIPGVIGGVGMSSRGKPGARSISLAVALVANLAAFFSLAPAFGAIGAAWAMVIGNLVLSATVMLLTRRIIQVSPLQMVAIRWSDVTGMFSYLTNFRTARRMQHRGEDSTSRTSDADDPEH